MSYTMTALPRSHTFTQSTQNFLYLVFIHLLHVYAEFGENGV